MIQCLLDITRSQLYLYCIYMYLTTVVKDNTVCFSDPTSSWYHQESALFIYMYLTIVVMDNTIYFSDPMSSWYHQESALFIYMYLTTVAMDNTICFFDPTSSWYHQESALFILYIHVSYHCSKGYTGKIWTCVLRMNRTTHEKRRFCSCVLRHVTLYLYVHVQFIWKWCLQGLYL